MTQSDNEYGRWARRSRAMRMQIEKIMGGKCFYCGTAEHLEFAHIRPTGLNGRGRGKYERLRDVRQNPGCYALLCVSCHIKYDAHEIELAGVEAFGAVR